MAEAAVARHTSTWACPSSDERADVQEENRSAGEGRRKLKLTPTEPTEGQLHATVAQYLDWALMPPAMYTTFPAGWGVLTRSTAGRLKGAGLKQGMPDILVFYKGRTFGIELKSWRGKLTSVQEAMHTKLLEAGVPVATCSSLDMVIDFLRDHGIPLRRTRGASDGERETA